MAVARSSVNVMKCGVRVRRGTSRHVFDAVASQHPRQRRLRGVDDDDDDVDNDDNDMRLPMQLPLALRRCRLKRRELRGGGGGLSCLTRVVLSRAQSLDDYLDKGGGGRGGIAVLLLPPSTDTRACNVGVEYVSFF